MAEKLDIQMRGIVDNIVFSKNEIWAYFAVNTQSYDFMDDGSKLNMLNNMTKAFADMMANKDERIPMHLIITNTPVDIDHWEDQFLRTTESWDRKPGFNKYFANQVQYLKSREYMSRKIYVGVKMADRHDVSMKGFMRQLEAGFDQALQYVKDIIFVPAGIDDYSISDKEIKNAKAMEEDYYNFFHSSEMMATRPEAEEIALVMKRTFYPSMPTPYLDVPANGRWGKGDMVRELGGILVKNKLWTEISQPMMGHVLTGYRATLTFSKFPENMQVPGGTPWIYMMQKMGLPFDMYGRFDLIPNKKMKKEVTHQKMDLEDEGGNAASGGHNISLDLQEDYQKAMELEAYTNKNDNPWLEGVYRMVITSYDVEDLKQTVEIVRNAYSSAGIILTWTKGDQQDLLLESMPGDKIRERSFMQTSNVELLGASGFNVFEKVGDDDMKS